MSSGRLALAGRVSLWGDKTWKHCPFVFYCCIKHTVQDFASLHIDENEKDG